MVDAFANAAGQALISKGPGKMRVSTPDPDPRFLGLFGEYNVMYG